MPPSRSMKVQAPTGVDTNRLLKFKGYGNPDGRYWFIGIEERGDGSDESLRIRSNFRQVEDLARIHGPSMLNFPMDTLIPTWATMSKIVMRLEGHASWRETEAVRFYQSEKLGRIGGETFLPDLLPLAAESASSWHYPWLYESRQAYEADILPQRYEMLAKMFLRHEPAYVFCYGKGYWGQFEKAFHAMDFQDILGGRLRIGKQGKSVVVLTPFFFYYTMTAELIDEMVRRLRRL